MFLSLDVSDWMCCLAIIQIACLVSWLGIQYSVCLRYFVPGSGEGRRKLSFVLLFSCKTLSQVEISCFYTSVGGHGDWFRLLVVCWCTHLLRGEDWRVRSCLLQDLNVWFGLSWDWLSVFSMLLTHNDTWFLLILFLLYELRSNLSADLEIVRDIKPIRKSYFLFGTQKLIFRVLS